MSVCRSTLLTVMMLQLKLLPTSLPPQRAYWKGTLGQFSPLGYAVVEMHIARSIKLPARGAHLNG